MKAVKVIEQDKENRSETSPIRRIYSLDISSIRCGVNESLRSQHDWRGRIPSPCLVQIGCYHRPIDKHVASCVIGAVREQ